ncbi:MAG TPA: hypothetical protein EYH34_11930 [Planctomycetes bacterium]|nr:hypothetical protein [Planctomycetota bacterium]
MRTELVVSVFAFCFMGPAVVRAVPQEHGNLVYNADFEQDADGDGVPDGWRSSGRRQIRQRLTLDAGHDGGRAAKLECTSYVGGTPDSHAMVCQVGKVPIRRGQWYRLSLWVKGSGIERGICEVAVSNMRPWQASGVAGRFAVPAQWQRIEILSRAARDVPAATSRLQFWFHGTGTLWLDDVVLEPVTVAEQLHPAIDTSGVTNPIPNSSFECGTAGWGSYSTAITSWSGNLYRLVGRLDRSTAAHGRCSLRISIDADRPIVYHWDYFDPIVQPVLTVQAAHFGWIPVQPGRNYVFSCYAKADRPDVPVRLVVYQYGGSRPTRVVRVGTEWKRYWVTLKPTKSFVWTAAGPDLSGSEPRRATVWLDAFQLEPGRQPQPYRPRAARESTIHCGAPGYIFTDPAQGLAVTVCFWNGRDGQRTMRGLVTVTDFFDREVYRQPVEADVPPGESRSVELVGLLAGRRGFFRVRWEPDDHRAAFEQSLRCAVIEAYPHDDSPFGMNHAYPWPFLLKLCRQAGLVWMRDWSAKWHTVEPRPGRWDFSKVDPQIERVRAAGLRPLVLLPFPSTPWCSEAEPTKIAEYATANQYQRRRAVVACLAKDASLFRNYVAQVSRRYARRAGWFEIMNEPLYTTYAVPVRFGYQLDDYIRLLKDAYETIKPAAPEANVIGGIGAWVEHDLVQQFIDAGGLRWCDVMDIHLYPVAIDPELYERPLADTWGKMQRRGEAKPIWLTEFGCYADDDPYLTPSRIGDAAMSRANWPSEREAAEALVQTAAVFLSHGVRKIFFHAGTCGTINGRDGGGIFFEYAGAPRKMYVAVSVLANLLGPNPQPVPLTKPMATATGSPQPSRLHAYLFKTPSGAVAILWSRAHKPIEFELPGTVRALDIMGNPRPGKTLKPTCTPIYLLARDAALLAAVLEPIIDGKQ